MADPRRTIAAWPDLYRPASWVAEHLGRSVKTVREWARHDKVRTTIWAPTGEKLVHLVDCQLRDRGTQRRNRRSTPIDTERHLDHIKGFNAH